MMILAPLSAAPAAGPQVLFESTQHDWGEIEKGAVLSHTFEFRNVGDGPLEIWEVESQCECTTPTLADERLEPGEKSEIVVTLDSHEQDGAITKEVYVYSNDPLQPQVTLTIYADVKPGMKIDPPSIDLGVVSTNGSPAFRVRLSSVDGTPFEVLRAHAGLPFLEATPVKPGEGGPSSEAVVEVKALSGGLPGQFVDFLVIETTHPLRSRVEVPLKGEVVGVFRVEPPRLAFGTAVVGSGKNLGEVAITYVGEGDGNLVEVICDSPVLRVEFSPYPAGSGGRLKVFLSDDAEPGRVAGTITVTTDHPDQPTIPIRVLGYVRR